jgi:hypothetical protein
MLGGPFHDEAQGSRRDAALDDAQGADIDLHRTTLVCRMEVRRVVVGIVESDHDAEEAAEFGHGPSLEIGSSPSLTCCAGSERPKIAPDFEEVTEGEEVERKEGLKSSRSVDGAPPHR